MKLIDKDALVADIERRIKNLYPKGGQGIVVTKILKDHYEDLLSFIDTLETKEVDLDTQIEDYINSHFTEGCDGGMISDWYKVLGGVHYKDLVEIAKHFFELGMAVNNKAQKGEEV